MGEMLDCEILWNWQPNTTHMLAVEKANNQALGTLKTRVWSVAENRRTDLKCVFGLV